MLSIVIPIFNEEEILEHSTQILYDYLKSKSIEFELIVVSNGSTDRSIEIGEMLAKKFTWFKFLTLPEKGVGSAFTAGVKAASAEWIISLDMDLSFELTFIDMSQDLLRYADMIIGSKTMGEQRRSPLRVIASQFYILCTQMLFDLTISDYSIGCKAYKKASITNALDSIDTWTGYVLDLCLFIKRNKGKIIQVGVTCNDKRQSHFNLWHEGPYRFWHLFKSWRRSRGKS